MKPLKHEAIELVQKFRQENADNPDAESKKILDDFFDKVTGKYEERDTFINEDLI